MLATGGPFASWGPAHIGRQPQKNLIKATNSVGFGFRAVPTDRIRVLLEAAGVNWNLLPTLTPPGNPKSRFSCGRAGTLRRPIDSRHDEAVNYNTTILMSVAVPIIVTVVILFVVRNTMAGGGRKKREQAENLMATGRKARAKILRVDPTGMVVNTINIQCWVTFLLEPLDGGSAFQAQKKILINQTKMPRVGDVWPAWFSPTDPNLFAVGMPDGASPEQVPLFREFGIPHPLDQAHAPAAATDDDGPVDELQKLADMKEKGLLTDAEFTAAKAKLLGGS